MPETGNSQPNSFAQSQAQHMYGSSPDAPEESPAYRSLHVIEQDSSEIRR